MEDDVSKLTLKVCFYTLRNGAQSHFSLFRIPKHKERYILVELR